MSDKINFREEAKKKLVKEFKIKMKKAVDKAVKDTGCDEMMRGYIEENLYHNLIRKNFRS